MIIRKTILRFFGGAIFLYILICSILYFKQEYLIFFPKRLSENYKYRFMMKFEEKSILTKDGKILNSILFKADSTKGLIFFLHGNAGALDKWGSVAKPYINMNYDTFILDYRGFGKSDGTIENEKQFYDDVQSAYNTIKSEYTEDNIVIVGYSIGTGAATMLASKNDPKMLILQAPYYSLIDLMRQTYKVIPTFILKYKFKTYEFLKEVKAPVIIFHGDKDEVIYHESSLKLKKYLKSTDQVIILKEQRHTGINENTDYLNILMDHL